MTVAIRLFLQKFLFIKSAFIHVINALCFYVNTYSPDIILYSCTDWNELIEFHGYNMVHLRIIANV